LKEQKNYFGISELFHDILNYFTIDIGKLLDIKVKFTEKELNSISSADEKFEGHSSFYVQDHSGLWYKRVDTTKDLF
jgi:hypothetical protein